MSKPVRLAINGAAGRMGRTLLELLHDDDRFVVVAAIIPAGAPRLGQVASPADEALRFTADAGESRPQVMIDFSGPAGLAAALDYCQDHGVALVSGTTGFDEALRARLALAARRIPLMHESNFSLGVAVLTQLLREAAAALPQWDLEIIEAHHGRKLDAPSGTARSLGEAAAAARGATLTRLAVQGARSGPREAGSIGFAVVRGGDIVGDHMAMLVGRGERLELGHRAGDRSIFARGAIEAAHWLATRAPGTYGLRDMLPVNPNSLK